MAVTETEEATEETKRTEETQENRHKQKECSHSKGVMHRMPSLEEKGTTNRERQKVMAENKTHSAHSSFGQWWQDKKVVHLIWPTRLIFNKYNLLDVRG